tara:strand:+ start:177 stop:422 length:246 start_codon:yes stop_codon:yes gene_type:complete
MYFCENCEKFISDKYKHIRTKSHLFKVENKNYVIASSVGIRHSFIDQDEKNDYYRAKARLYYHRKKQRLILNGTIPDKTIN